VCSKNRAEPERIRPLVVIVLQGEYRLRPRLHAARLIAETTIRLVPGNAGEPHRRHMMHSLKTHTPFRFKKQVLFRNFLEMRGIISPTGGRVFVKLGMLVSRGET
jgi:hypothetical protein